MPDQPRTYETSEVAHILRLKPKAIVNMADRGIVRPQASAASGSGSRRRYTWENVVQIALVHTITSLGFPTAVAVTALDRLDAVDVWTRYTKDRFLLVLGCNPFDPHFKDVDPRGVSHLEVLVRENGITVADQYYRQLSERTHYHGLAANVKLDAFDEETYSGDVIQIAMPDDLPMEPAVCLIDVGYVIAMAQVGVDSLDFKNGTG